MSSKAPEQNREKITSMTQEEYVFGPENGSLSPELATACEFIVKIPSCFCLNVKTAGAIVMYGRMLSMGKFAERLVKPGGRRLAGRKGRDRVSAHGRIPANSGPDYFKFLPPFHDI